MKTKLIISTVGLVLLSSCAKTDLYDAEEVEKVTSQTNAEKVLGMKIDPNQDWCTTVSGQVTIKADASVTKVELMVDALEYYEDWTNPGVTTRSTLKTINQAELQGETSITLNYDAPEANNGLYVAFITNDGGYHLTKVENGVATLNRAKTRGEGESSVLNSGYELPEKTVHVAGSAPSFASMEKQGWNPDEVLYYLNDYSALKPKKTPGDYSTDFKVFFKTYLNNKLPNGRKNDNSYKVQPTIEYNNGVYVSSVEGEPIILTPVYKYDHPTKYGFEVYRSDLYYYYYKDSEVKDMNNDELVAFLKSLPKYKAIPFDQVFGDTEDAQVKRHNSYCLPLFETKTSTTVATADTPCTYVWKKGYKIGFMVQAKTDADDGLKQGEIYGDGRLNNNINNWGNFATSGLGDPKTDYPRQLWFSFNDKVFMSWESGTDKDFNDIVIQMEGGYVIPKNPDPDLQWFTYCFEYHVDGDYDMNDVVIKATRIDETTVEYRIVACGAYDDICIVGLNCGKITDDAEVHELFGVKDHHTFINTDGSNYDFVVGTMKVSKNFSFLSTKQQPYLVDKTNPNTVKLAGLGQGPHGVLIPTDFLYPTEKTHISEAYSDFIGWGEGDKTKEEWYTKPILNKVR